MDINILFYPILIPLAGGLLALLSGRAKGFICFVAFVATLLTLVTSVYIFTNLPAGKEITTSVGLTLAPPPANEPIIELRAARFNGFMLSAISLFGFLIALYSVGFMRKQERLNKYYAFTLWAVGAACGTVIADNLLLLLIAWEVVTLMLYLLVNMGTGQASAAAAKTFAITGFSDCSILLAVVMLWGTAGTLKISALHVEVHSYVQYVIYVLLMIGALTKAGAIPFHSWIPTAAEYAPTPTTALLPAAIDKLLGIYLLAIISLDIFRLTPTLRMVLLVIGALTIISAVMMAMIQHNFKRLLGFHAVSQVGYMVMGIGTGIPVGIAGGLFHMVNNAIYKSCLFLCAGNVEDRTGTTDLEKLGGLARSMPLTFVACLIAAMSISGVPPFNGFASKWMVYQGIIDMGAQGSKSFPIFLVAAMFGSALTLASFVKVLHSVFWGQKPTAIKENTREESFSMTLPVVVLSLLCVVFGVFYTFPLTAFIQPALKSQLLVTGVWSAVPATILIVIGLLVGLLFYTFGKVLKFRQSRTYLCGEKVGELVDQDAIHVPGTDFYNTVRSMGILKGIYSDSEKGVFDLYRLAGQYGNSLVQVLRELHNGLLPTYLAWCVVGLAIFILVIIVPLIGR